MRHAKSSWSDPKIADFDRPPNKRGRRDAPLMGQWIATHLPAPDRVVSSPARRARETAEAVVAALRRPPATIVWEPRLYAASRLPLLAVIREQPDSAGHVLLVAHNPGLTELANTLCNDSLENLPTAAIYSLNLPLDRWSKTCFGVGVRRAFVTPKQLQVDSQMP